MKESLSDYLEYQRELAATNNGYFWRYYPREDKSSFAPYISNILKNKDASEFMLH